MIYTFLHLNILFRTRTANFKDDMGYYVKGKKNIQKIELTWKGWYDGIWGHKFACSRDLLKFYDVLFYILWYYYYEILWYLDILIIYQYLYKI